MKRSTIVILVVVISVLLAACGGGTEEPEQVSINIKGQDSFRYDPETLSVRTGAQVTLTLENTGVLEHSWTLIPDTVDPVEADDTDALGGAATGIVPGGQSGTVTFAAPPAGTYTFVCTVPGHASGGKIGTLTVTQ